MVVLGTRPELIKLAPLIWKLRDRQGTKVTVVFSNQHAHMLQSLSQTLRITPDLVCPELDQHTELSARLGQMTLNLGQVMQTEQPDLVIAQGDTATTMASAMAAHNLGVRFAHVEAGLRSHDLTQPWPEEGYRRMITRITALHFAPTSQAAKNLRAEGVKTDHITITGNSVIDTLLTLAPEATKPSGWPVTPQERYILMTLHRRENVTQEHLSSVFLAVRMMLKAHPKLHVVWPVHPNPKLLPMVHEALGDVARVHLLEPMPYLDFVWAMGQAYLLLSDSGGLQEEAPALGVPLLVMRQKTERPEALDAGAMKLVGTRAELIVSEVKRLLEDPAEVARMRAAPSPYGDGRASERIMAVLFGGQVEAFEPEC